MSKKTMNTTNESPLKLVPHKKGHFTHSLYINDELLTENVIYSDGIYDSEHSYLDYNLILPLQIKQLPDNMRLGYFDLSVYRELQLFVIIKANNVLTLKISIAEYDFANSFFNYNRFIKLLIKKIKITEQLKTEICGDPEVDFGESLSMSLLFSSEYTETTTVEEIVVQMKAVVKPYYEEVVREILKEGEDWLNEEERK